MYVHVRTCTCVVCMYILLYVCMCVGVHEYNLLVLTTVESFKPVMLYGYMDTAVKHMTLILGDSRISIDLRLNVERFLVAGAPV